MSGTVVRYGAIAALLFGGARLGLGAVNSDENSKETVPSVLSVDPPAVSRVAITSAGSRVELFRSPDGTWTAGSGGSPEAAELMAHFEGRLFPLLGYRSLPVAASNPEFGLATPTVVLDVEAIGGRRQTVAFGGPTFNTGGVYAGRPSGAERVFLVPRHVAEDLRSIVAGRIVGSTEPSLADQLNDRINGANQQRVQPGTTSPWLRQVLDSGADVPSGPS